MESYNFCGACLVTDTKMYCLTSSDIVPLRKMYLDLVIPTIDTGQYMCYECAAVLEKCYKFKEKCNRAQSALAAVCDVNRSMITKSLLKKINREEYNLVSSIEQTTIVVVDTYKNNSMGSDQIKTELHSDMDSDEIKIEHHSYIKGNNMVVTTSNDEIDEAHFVNLECDNIDILPNIEIDMKSIKSEDEPILINKLKTKKCKSKNNVGKYGRKRKHSKCHDSALNKIEVKRKKVNKHNIQKPENESGCNEIETNDNNENEETSEKEMEKKNESVFKLEEHGKVVRLTMDEAKKELLLRQESDSYKKMLFKCELCFRGFIAMAAYENHKKKHSEESGKFPCDVCQVRFFSHNKMMNHRTQSHIRKFYCKSCPYFCFGSTLARSHINLHKGNKYTCELCGKSYKVYKNMLSHKRNVHAKCAACALCGDAFVTPRGLEQHTHLIHKLEENKREGPHCADCDVHFSTEAAWRRHLITSSKHTTPKSKTTCKSCGKEFPSRKQLATHRVTVHGLFVRPPLSFPSDCRKCGVPLADAAQYRAHVKAEHPEGVGSSVCHVCGKVMANKYQLAAHMWTHAERRYNCHECDKSYTSVTSLLYHSNSHRGLKPFACSVCPRTFTARTTRDRHLKMHLDIRPHACAICEKRFITPSDLRAHVRHAHHKAPYPRRRRRGADHCADL